jgi:hypothetical protein
MITATDEPAAIARYLRALRDRDRAAIGASGDEADAVARLVDAHTVVMAHGAFDEPVEESLATWLSLLDDEAWRERVRAIRVDAAFLGEREQALLARIQDDARMPVAVA